MKQIPFLNLLAIIFSISSIIILITRYHNDNNNKINRLIRQTARWASAADQDTNPYITNLHATYAMGYLMALREIYTDNEIKKASNVDIRKLETQINTIMDNAIQLLSNVCPEGQPKNAYIAFLAKEGGMDSYLNQKN